MNKKHLITIFIVLFAYMLPVHSQLDARLEDLIMMGREGTDIDDTIESTEEVRPREETIVEDDDTDEDETEDDFGYQGRNDFLVAPKSKFTYQKLERFGYDYFADNQNAFLPTKDTPIPSDYILGPGDIVKIILFGNNNKKYTLQVTREGDIFLPEIGPIAIAGLSFGDVKETIKQIVENQLIGTQATLTLGELRAVNIFVLGEALNPGMYTVSALSTLTNAVFANGGVKNTGSLRNIQLKRNGKIVSKFDFYDLLLNGDTSKDIRLMSGDVVFIPPTEKLVGISGEVKRPGIYELKENENGDDLLSFAGSLKAKADLTSLQLERIDSRKNSFNLISVNLDLTPFSSLELQDGDKLSIYPVTEKLNNAILLRGHAAKPGFYPWSNGMKILDVISEKDDLLPLTDMSYLLLKRESNIGQNYEFIHINIQSLLEDKNEEDNILLENRDELIFFPSVLDINLIRTVESDITYDNQDSQLATHYAKKSIIEKQSAQSGDASRESLPSPDMENKDSFEQKDQPYFHYYVYDYCVVKEGLLLELLDLQAEIDQIVEEVTNEEADQTKSLKLTKYCRDQIIEPLLALIEQQSSPNNQEQVITVFGNVKFPGKYPLVTNASVQEGLAAAGGLKGLTYTDEIDITKKSYLGKEVIEVSSSVDFDEIKSMKLDPLDIITVKKLDYRPAVVTILGEVHFPGQYPISNNETFKTLIARAGGFKNESGIENTFFQRQSLIESELEQFEEAQSNLKKQLLLASNDTLGSSEDADDYLNKILMLAEEEPPETSSLGRLVIDTAGIMDGSAKDIRLIDGDTIIVPRKRQTVKVIGEVYAPNSHFFDSNKNPSDYIELSGGLNDFADKENIYVIKQDGSVVSNLSSSGGFFRASSENITAGDTIVVPLKVSTFSGLRATTEISQIVYQMALSAAAVNSFRN